MNVVSREGIHTGFHHTQNVLDSQEQNGDEKNHPLDGAIYLRDELFLKIGRKEEEQIVIRAFEPNKRSPDHIMVNDTQQDFAAKEARREIGATTIGDCRYRIYLSKMRM